MPHDDVTVRSLKSLEDYAACVALQRMIWGYGDTVPSAVLMVAQKVGGVAAGAFDATGALLGCVFGLTGLRDGRPVHWSHFLAVRPDLRDRGIGRRLKEFQRDLVRTRGIERMYWTFDPLAARNAHLNLNRLGARVEEYVPDLYGGVGRSGVDPVLGTDRFVVSWDLRTTTREPDDPAITLQESDPVLGLDAEPPFPDAQVVGVAVPEDIDALKVTAAEEALAWRLRVRRILLHYLGRRYRVAGFVRRSAGGGRYALGAP